MAVETFWFVHPDHRGQGLSLLVEFEKWGKREGCQTLAMIHMVDSFPDKLETLYRRRGYKLIEKHYLKEI
jgi:GNAT superfamily N-acetyltransferase